MIVENKQKKKRRNNNAKELREMQICVSEKEEIILVESKKKINYCVRMDGCMNRCVCANGKKTFFIIFNFNRKCQNETLKFIV